MCVLLVSPSVSWRPVPLCSSFRSVARIALPLLLGVALHLLRRTALRLTRHIRSVDYVLCGVVTATNPLFSLNYVQELSTYSCQRSGNSFTWESHFIWRRKRYLQHCYCVFCSTLLKFDARDVHNKVLKDCEFREKRRNRGHDLLAGVNQFLTYFLLLSSDLARYSTEKIFTVVYLESIISWRAAQWKLYFT